MDKVYFFTSRENRMIEWIVLHSDIKVGALVAKLEECDNLEARIHYLTQQMRFKDLSAHVPSKVALEFCHNYAEQEPMSYERKL